MRDSMPIALSSICLITCLSLATSTSGKPDKVDGENYPSGRIPQVIKNNKYPRTYFPNTEKLGKNEMRITIFGSGYGYVRRGQANQSIYVELGNGDTFIFDMGEGAEANYMTMQVPYSKMTYLFLTHLHMDHLGALTHL